MSTHEIGGDFHWFSNFPAPYLGWPAASCWFARGRDAAAAVLNRQSRVSGSRLFVPGFFCDEVVTAWQEFGMRIARYQDLPGQTFAQFPDGAPTAADVILIINYFGVDERRHWASRLADEFGVLTLEDHTHDPFSEWAGNSSADFAMASLRKTCPVSDGAILWSPRQEADAAVPLPTVQYSDLQLLASMTLKSTYLFSDHSTAELKSEFRSLQSQGHQTLDAAGPLLGISSWSQKILASGYPKAWRDRRQANAAHLRDRLLDLAWPPLLFSTWQNGQCPFAVVLKFENSSERDRVRAELTRRKIYAPVHWFSKNSPDGNARELGERLLSLPVDHRYLIEDMDTIAEALQAIKGS